MKLVGIGTATNFKGYDPMGMVAIFISENGNLVAAEKNPQEDIRPGEGVYVYHIGRHRLDQKFFISKT